VISILIDALSSPASLLDRLGTPDMPSDQMRRLLGHPLLAQIARDLDQRTGEQIARHCHLP
jgi:hypothetical protein